MNRVPCFTEKEDPVLYDTLALTALRAKFSHRLLAARDHTKRTKWFNNELLNRAYQDRIPWPVVARLLIYGFASADALRVKPRDIRTFWPEYIFLRISPLALLNNSMADGKFESAINSSLMNLLAVASGYKRLQRSPKMSCFWPVYAERLRAMISVVYAEDLIRFDESYLHNPERILNDFETKDCPWLRSSALEMLMLGIADMFHYRLKSVIWLREFEQMRQLLDDIADIQNDLVTGRLTFPTLVALKNDSANGELLRLIQKIWRTPLVDRRKAVTKHWRLIKRKLIDSGAIESSLRRIHNWQNRIEIALYREDFPGTTRSLEILLELKRAFAKRIEVDALDVRASQFDFFEPMLPPNSSSA